MEEYVYTKHALGHKNYFKQKAIEKEQIEKLLSLHHSLKFIVFLLSFLSEKTKVNIQRQC
jgi:hypothetical protein